MTRQMFQQVAMAYLNIPYLWGGDDPIKGFDCSGFVQELLTVIGQDPPGDQTCQALYDHFKKSGAAEGVLDTGSICFYGKSIKEIVHAAVMLDESTIIEAGSGDSKTVDIAAAVKQNAFVRLRPYNRRKDLVCVLLPSGLPWDTLSAKRLP